MKPYRPDHKGHIRSLKGTVPFRKGLARTLVCLDVKPTLTPNISKLAHKQVMAVSGFACEKPWLNLHGWAGFLNY